MNKVKGFERVGYYALVALLYVALIMRAYIHKLDPITAKFVFKNAHLDLFSHGKAVFLCTVVGVALVMGIATIWRKKDKGLVFRQFEYYLLGLMVLLVILSTLFSDNPDVALLGFMDRYEGMWVWLAYLAIPFLMRLFVSDFEKIKTYSYYLVLAVSVPFFIGFLQYMGYDIITKNWFRYFVFPLDQINQFGTIQLSTPSVYATLYNQNFVGGLVALTLPLAWYLHSVLSSKNKRLIVLFGSSVATVSLVGAHSTAGYIAFIMVSFAYTLKFILLDGKWTLKSGLPHLVSVSIAFVLGATNALTKTEIINALRLYIAVTLLCFVGIFVAVILKEFVSADFLKRKSTMTLICILLFSAGIFCVSTLVNRDIPSSALTTSKSESVVDPASPRQIVDIQDDGQKVTIVTDRDQLTFTYIDGEVTVLNKEGFDVPLAPTEFSDVFIPVTPEYAGYQFKFYDQKKLLEVKINSFHNGVADQLQILIQLTEKNVSIAGLDAKPIEISAAPYIGFRGNEGFATNRGYIWSRTLPLILESPIIGYGADTFPLHFPQYDINKFKIANNFFFLIDKPHNGFLQMAFSFGILFLIAYLMLVGSVLIKLLNKLMIEKDSFALTLMIILISFNIIALINDSVVEVNPYLWIMMGLSMAYTGVQREAVTVRAKKTKY